jgi:hypothetical protein
MVGGETAMISSKDVPAGPARAAEPFSALWVAGAVVGALKWATVLRHDYDDVNLDVIVKLRGAPVADLRAAVVALLKKYDPESDRFIDR